MRRAGALFACMMMGCEPAEPARDDWPAWTQWTRPANCGSGVCDANESLYYCPEDCFNDRIRLERKLEYCGSPRNHREKGELVEFSLELAESMVGVRHAIKPLFNFARALRAPHARLFGAELTWFERIAFAFDERTATYVLNAPMWDGFGEVKATFGRSYERFAAGSAIPANVFDPTSYLVGSRLTGSGRSLTYDRVGPLVELLGQGATPPNPIVIEDTRVTEEIAAHSFSFRVGRPRAIGERRTSFVLRGVLRPGDEDIAFELESATGSDARFNANVLVSSFEMRHGSCGEPGQCAVWGSAKLEVPDGPMPHAIEIKFSSQPTVIISCL